MTQISKFIDLIEPDMTVVDATAIIVHLWPKQSMQSSFVATKLLLAARIAVMKAKEIEPHLIRIKSVTPV